MIIEKSPAKRATPKARKKILDTMNLIEWKLKEKVHIKRTMSDEQSWELLQKKVAACEACALSQSRTQTVFGVGDKKARIFLIGEAPGEQEDLTGEPFVGRAGKLLDEILKALKLSRKNIYIANILKCRPPNNRNPSPSETITCTPFLEAQIKLVQPALLVALGRVAAQYLLNTEAPLMSLRGKVWTFENTKTPLMVTYHPAYLLRNPPDKKKAWEDWKAIDVFSKKMIKQ